MLIKRSFSTVFHSLIHSLANWYIDDIQEYPLSHVMQVHAYEEDQKQQYEQGPEFSRSPLCQPQLGKQLTCHVLDLLLTLTVDVTFVGEWLSVD